MLLSEAADGLVTDPDGVYVDGTFGQGGHAKAILDKLSARGRLIALDKDIQAVQAGQERFKTDNRLTLIHQSFSNLIAAADEMKLRGKVNGILLDLGVSSVHLEDAERGFSFMRDGPLDMRLDRTQGITAAQWLNKVSEEELTDVIKNYGEERYARRIARRIVESRRQTPLNTTKQLADIVRKALPRDRREKKHPATRTFQAIRIFVNNELGELQKGLAQGLEVLSGKGRLAVISFHSLEDRIVKRFMRYYEKGESFPSGFPLIKKFVPRLARMGKSIRPQAEEILSNARARSAVLRIAEKIV